MKHIKKCIAILIIVLMSHFQISASLTRAIGSAVSGGKSVIGIGGAPGVRTPIQLPRESRGGVPVNISSINEPLQSATNLQQAKNIICTPELKQVLANASKDWEIANQSKPFFEVSISQQGNLTSQSPTLTPEEQAQVRQLVGKGGALTGLAKYLSKPSVDMSESNVESSVSPASIKNLAQFCRVNDTPALKQVGESDLPTQLPTIPAYARTSELTETLPEEKVEPEESSELSSEGEKIPEIINTTDLVEAPTEQVVEETFEEQPSELATQEIIESPVEAREEIIQEPQQLQLAEKQDPSERVQEYGEVPPQTIEISVRKIELDTQLQELQEAAAREQELVEKNQQELSQLQQSAQQAQEEFTRLQQEQAVDQKDLAVIEQQMIETQWELEQAQQQEAAELAAQQQRLLQQEEQKIKELEAIEQKERDVSGMLQQRQQVTQQAENQVAQAKQNKAAVENELAEVKNREQKAQENVDMQKQIELDAQKRLQELKVKEEAAQKDLIAKAEQMQQMQEQLNRARNNEAAELAAQQQKMIDALAQKPVADVSFIPAQTTQVQDMQAKAPQVPERQLPLEAPLAKNGIENTRNVPSKNVVMDVDPKNSTSQIPSEKSSPHSEMLEAPQGTLKNNVTVMQENMPTKKPAVDIESKAESTNGYQPAMALEPPVIPPLIPSKDMANMRMQQSEIAQPKRVADISLRPPTAVKEEPLPAVTSNGVSPEKKEDLILEGEVREVTAPVSLLIPIIKDKELSLQTKPTKPSALSTDKSSLKTTTPSRTVSSRTAPRGRSQIEVTDQRRTPIANSTSSSSLHSSSNKSSAPFLPSVGSVSTSPKSGSRGSITYRPLHTYSDPDDYSPSENDFLLEDDFLFDENDNESTQLLPPAPLFDSSVPSSSISSATGSVPLFPSGRAGENNNVAQTNTLTGPNPNSSAPAISFAQPSTSGYLLPVESPRQSSIPSTLISNRTLSGSRLPQKSIRSHKKPATPSTNPVVRYVIATLLLGALVGLGRLGWLWIRKLM